MASPNPERPADAASSKPGEVTRLLRELSDGGDGAQDHLAERVYADLRAIAGRALGSYGSGHTLQPTALVNEAFLELFEKDRVAWADRQHFFAFAANVMRELLVDHERARRALKRGGDRRRVTLDERLAGSAEPNVDLLDLDAALTDLAALDARQAQLVELRYFGGLEVAEAADALGISKTTAERDWRLARAWLGRALESGAR